MYKLLIKLFILSSLIVRSYSGPWACAACVTIQCAAVSACPLAFGTCCAVAVTVPPCLIICSAPTP